MHGVPSAHGMCSVRHPSFEPFLPLVHHSLLHTGWKRNNVNNSMNFTKMRKLSRGSVKHERNSLKTTLHVIYDYCEELNEFFANHLEDMRKKSQDIGD